MTLVPFFHLLIFISLFPQFIYVKADQVLIDRLCAATPEETTQCQVCIRSNPDSASADGKAIGAILSDCSQSSTAALRDTLMGSASSASDPEVKIVLTNCVDKVVTSWTYFFVLMVNLQGGDYDGAMKTINEKISHGVNECLASFIGNPKVKVPPEVLTGTSNVNNDLNILISVIGKLR